MSTPSTCPHCGYHVPAGARACPACGSDDETGWSEEAQANRLGLPSDQFDYDQFVREEFGSTSRPCPVRPLGISWFWWGVTVLVLVLLIFLWVF